MANITLQHITPIHFYETVKALKTLEYDIYLSVDRVDIRFRIKRFETHEETLKRFDQMEHIQAFLYELTNSSVPIDDWDEFIHTYRR
ncbi:hypothetical protein QJU89_03040 [Pasteurella skyensis]|uniref:Uncharacterized protein n=1 Tax=Phocoenobacter skyensis TaxID=97481 RepID=A0AAJ6NBK2_9PAST|nr:hypothetical protein [Pasteurella skyensis]MDP8163499.1 hypothetical protein [Pasteurella skyensis]MDP8173814.1 hypothetical protein [Pasteurella skyensis]MDP8179963.1 hypothetical protein [Pasteurella skyensis]MDP8182660.1 hypothetical protein [Pasteurella skyensis]MDP8182673.1 hypothetical protein [Pasteurella skyensis]